VNGKLGPVKMAAIHHDFQAEDTSEDYGAEVDLVATWPINKQFSVQAKYASFSADSNRYDDIDKCWPFFLLIYRPREFEVVRLYLVYVETSVI
jgi:hypothetical protein